MIEPQRNTSQYFKGRGATFNPTNRFEKISVVFEESCNAEDNPSLKTEFFKDSSRSFITYNDSPDVGFSASINPYRGCEHGCIYCFARPTHEYLGFSSGLDFETKIMVKMDAPQLLRKELSSPKWQPQVLAFSGVTDCYQPIERHLKLTRQCLEVLREFRNPVGIVTKNHLVARDIDLLKELNRFQAAAVFISVTTLDHRLASLMEPRASCPEDRLKAIQELSQEQIPVGVLVAPVIPALTDHEIPSIVSHCAKAGATFAGYVMLRLPFAVKNLFEEWLIRHFPDRKEKILNRIRDIRSGKLNDPRYGLRLKGEGVFAQEIAQLFSLACKKEGLNRKPELSTASFLRPQGSQPTLF